MSGFVVGGRYRSMALGGEMEVDVRVDKNQVSVDGVMVTVVRPGASGYRRGDTLILDPDTAFRWERIG